MAEMAWAQRFTGEGLAATFSMRLERYGPELAQSLRAVYGARGAETMARVEDLMAKALAERSPELRRLDEARLVNPDWLQRPEMMGYVTYADRFAGTLTGVADHIDYLQGLGIKYLHLMPLLKPRDGENDGGYAVQDYRAVRPDLGSMADLESLATKLRQRGMSLVMDLVLNHVALEHEWAVKACAGDQKYRDYFYMYPDRTEPDAYEQTLPEVFPDFAPGNFTWSDAANAWVWTTFNSYQWDVNWGNPDVFCEFLDIILYLANQGVEVVRLDAIAFIWKRLGTNCQNQPEVHHLTRALRAAARIVAPAVAFKAEAIVAPHDLIAYLGVGIHHGKVSDTAYHNTLMVQLWSALASRDKRLLEVALAQFPPKPTNAVWATYVRCHDDIGWAVSDEDAARAGIDGWGHRKFLSDFYSGEYHGSFAKGMVFQYNPVTQDRRISGTCASLAGLESAIQSGDQGRIDHAVRRVLLMYAVILGFGGIPLLYMGDELGLLNDYSFADDPDHTADNRWVHRPKMDWGLVEQVARESSSPAGRINAGLRHLIWVRAHSEQLHASVEAAVMPYEDERLLLIRRDHPTGAMVQVYNVSENQVYLPTHLLRSHVGAVADEKISGYEYSLEPHHLIIEPYQALWLVEKTEPLP